MSVNFLLSLCTWLPILGGIVTLACGDRRAVLARRVALAFSVLALIVTIPLYTGFNQATHAMQFVEDYAWIEAFGIRYRLGIDGISLLMILLTSFTTVLIVI